MKQEQQVINVMRALGGIATFGKLNSEIDFTSWGTKNRIAHPVWIIQAIRIISAKSS